MKIEEVINCFNASLADHSYHYVVVSKWERIKGPIKRAVTSIYKVEGKLAKEVVTKEYCTSIPAGGENTLIEETQRRALIEFIKVFYNNDK